MPKQLVRTPIYQQLNEALRDLIREGEFETKYDMYKDSDDSLHARKGGPKPKGTRGKKAATINEEVASEIQLQANAMLKKLGLPVE